MGVVLVGGRGTELDVGAPELLVLLVLLLLFATDVAALLPGTIVLLLVEPIMGPAGVGTMELVLGPIMLVGGP